LNCEWSNGVENSSQSRMFLRQTFLHFRFWYPLPKLSFKSKMWFSFLSDSRSDSLSSFQLKLSVTLWLLVCVTLLSYDGFFWSSGWIIVLSGRLLFVKSNKLLSFAFANV
jgi:hypothetical protein